MFYNDIITKFYFLILNSELGGCTMYEKFEDYFKIEIKNNENSNFNEITYFKQNYQGMTFGNGLYRVFNKVAINKWKQIITEGYPDFENCFEPFAYDWLGRCFAVDIRNGKMGNVLMFEIGTADVLEIPCNFMSFHEEEIPLYHDSCLASSFFNEWRINNTDDLQNDKCVGYKIPLFLGGTDTVDNLEVSDMEVYWNVCSYYKNRI